MTRRLGCDIFENAQVGRMQKELLWGNKDDDEYVVI